MMRKIPAIILISLLMLSLAPVLFTPATAEPADSREDVYYKWGAVSEAHDTLVNDPVVLTTHDQDVLVLWKEEGLGFAHLSKAGEVITSGTLVPTGDDWAAALDQDEIVVVWTQDRRLKFQRFDIEGLPISIERTVSIDSSSLSCPSVSVASDGTIYASFVTDMNGAPRAVYVALNPDGSTLVPNRLVDVDDRNVLDATITAGDGDHPYMLIRTSTGTELVALSKKGSVEWYSLLFNDGQGTSPDLSVRNGLIVPTWRVGDDLNWIVMNAQGSVIGSDGIEHSGMSGSVSTALDSRGYVHAIIHDGSTLVHLVLRTGVGLLNDHIVATGIGPAIAFDMTVDDFNVVHNVHALSSLFYCHADTYAFELVSSDLTAFEVVHPGQTVAGTMTLRNRGGMVDAIGLETDIHPAGSGWAVEVSEDEIYLSGDGTNDAVVTVFAPEDGQDGDTADLHISLKALSMPSMAIEMDVPIALKVRYGLSLDTLESFKTLPPGFSEDFSVLVTNDGEVKEDIYLFATAEATGGSNPAAEWSVTLSQDHIILEPEGTGEVLATVTAPSIAREGQLKTIQVAAMIQEDKAISDKLNLYALAMSEVQLSLEMMSEDGSAWSTIGPGDTAEYEVAVRNDGKSDSTVTVNLEVVSGFGDWDAFLGVSSLSLKGGDVAIVPLSVVAPEDAIAGQRFVVRLKATSNRMLSEAHLDITTFVSKEARISVKTMNRYAEADPGKLAHYQFEVTNEGNGDEVLLFFSDTPFGWEPMAFSVDGVPVGGYLVGIGQTQVIDADVRVPKAANTDDYKVQIRVVNGENKELDLVTHVNMVSDIWISAAETVREAVDGKASFNFRVRNYGNGPDEVQFIPEGLPEGWAVELPDIPGGYMTLTQGKERLMDMDVTVPENVQEGDFEFSLKALPLRGDGVLVKLLIKVVASDLEIVAVDFSTESFMEGDVEAVTVTVRNNGPGIAGRVVVLAEDNGRTFGQDEVYVIRAGAEATMTFTWAVDEGSHDLRFTVDPENRIFEKDETNNREEVRVVATSRSGQSNQVQVEVLAGATFTISLALIGTAVASTEWGRVKLIWWFWVPLYTKLKRTGVLDHFVRGQVYGYIKANPGEHYNAIKKALDMKNGTLVYHLQTLEREEYIKSASDGRYKRFYPAGMRVPDEPAKRLNKIQEIILRIIGEHPGISQKEIAEEIGLSSATINYHINVMIKAKVIWLEKIGRTTHCYVLEEEEEPAGPEPGPEGTEDKAE